MLAGFDPSVEHGFVLPLIWGASEDEGVFDPDATSGEIEACVLEGAAEVQSFGVGVENIGARTFLTNPDHARKRGEQEVIELIAIHLVILDRQARAGFKGDIVWRVREHKVRALPIHQSLNVGL